MKKIIAFLFIAVSLVVLSIDIYNPAQVFTWRGENANPIPAIFGLAEKDIENIYLLGSQYREGRATFADKEQYTWLLNNIRKLELLEKIDDYDINGAKNIRCYEIQLKNAEPIILNFYDGIIDFGQGCYSYTDADDSIMPDEINKITVSLPEFNSAIYYDNPNDIEALSSVLTVVENTNATLQNVEDFSKLMSIYINDWLSENISLYIKVENRSYYLFKNFFTSYIYMGEISKDSYDSLTLACKNQFGTHEHFSVTSGETTIYPTGHFMGSISYDKQTGQGLAADGSPQHFSEWVDKLETLTYEPNFALRAKDEQTIIHIALAETRASLTYEDIEALPAGEYIIECRLTIQGDYVKKADSYNSSTSVYWFKLIKL